MIYKVKLKIEDEIRGYWDEVYVDADSITEAEKKAIKKIKTDPKLKLVVKSIEETDIQIIS